MKLAIYARVSTNMQSPELQLADLRAYAVARGFAVYREYVDLGVSGSKSSRPELDAMMNDAKKRKFDMVLVWRFDRFARSTRHLITALEDFRSLGIAFVSYQENLDTSSPMGNAIFTIIAAVAQLERDMIRERVTAGVRRAIQKRGTWGRKAVTIDLSKVQGLSTRKAAEVLGVSRETVRLARGESKSV
jgi:DNA invertase Pin-like site-specific DNA recombinase